MLADFPQFNHGDGQREAELRVAVLGIGNELNGDDAAGVMAARGLSEILGKGAVSKSEAAIAVPAEGIVTSPEASFLIIEAGPSPESFTGPLRRFRPNVVIMIDAAELDESPGTVRWFDWRDAAGMGGSTHTLPPSMLAKFLMAELGCQVYLIGIQPVHLEFDEGVSKEIEETVRQLVIVLAAKLTRND